MRALRLYSLSILALMALAACATPPTGTGSPGTTGAPATAGQIAQTVSGQQGQAPSTATGGTAAVNWYFASSVPSEIVGPVLAIAAEQKWTAEQIASVLQSANGAPQTVNITTSGNTASGGNASSIPAGTGGSAGASGTGNTVSPPR